MAESAISELQIPRLICLQSSSRFFQAEFYFQCAPPLLVDLNEDFRINDSEKFSWWFRRIRGLTVVIFDPKQQKERPMKNIAALIIQTVLLTTVLLWVPATQADIIESFGSGANQFNMTFVPIGNSGNVADTTGNPNPAGSVAYNYRMGKFTVSREMIIKANAEGNLGMTLQDMVGIGIPTGNGGNRPATGVSWNEAARFVNWMNTSRGFAPAYKFAQQPGDAGYSANSDISLWLAGDEGFNAANPFRNAEARYFLPSMDE